jgi:hypothetical protein
VGDGDALAGCASSRTQLLDLHRHTVLAGLIEPTDELKDVKVLQTFVSGRSVYDGLSAGHAQ